MNRIIAVLCGLLFVVTLYCRENAEQNLTYQQLIDNTRYADALRVLEADTISPSVNDECERQLGIQLCYLLMGHIKFDEDSMSLWAVNDNATQMLMTEFYTNWIEKKQSKREAFRNAQNAVRYAVDKDGDRMYENPVYWAGFIMLD